MIDWEVLLTPSAGTIAGGKTKEDDILLDVVVDEVNQMLDVSLKDEMQKARSVDLYCRTCKVEKEV